MSSLKMVKRMKCLLVLFVFNCKSIIINAETVNGNTDDVMKQVIDENTKYVIFDTDMGADDAWALQMVLKVEREYKNVTVLAITTVDGITDVVNATKNTYRILDGLDRTDIPIYKGASEAIIPISAENSYFYGRNGFGDIDIWKPSYPKDWESIIQRENAIEIIRKLVLKHPNQISFVCIGPLTNIALAIKAFPEIKNKFKEVYIMGGSYTGRGNIVPTAEFNFYHDPEAVFIVLNYLKCPIFILPLETDENLHLTMEWRLDVVGQSSHPNVQLLTKIEKMSYEAFNETVYLPFDTFAAGSFLFPNNMVQEMNRYKATMELHGLYTRGQMIVDRQSKDINVFIIEKIFEEEFKRIMLWAAELE